MVQIRHMQPPPADDMRATVSVTLNAYAQQLLHVANDFDTATPEQRADARTELCGYLAGVSAGVTR